MAKKKKQPTSLFVAERHTSWSDRGSWESLSPIRPHADAAVVMERLQAYVNKHANRDTEYRVVRYDRNNRARPVAVVEKKSKDMQQTL